MGPELNFDYVRVVQEYDRFHNPLPIPRDAGNNIIRFKGYKTTYDPKLKSYIPRCYKFIAYDAVAIHIKHMHIIAGSELIIRGEMQWENFSYSPEVSEVERFVCKIIAIDFHYSGKHEKEKYEKLISVKTSDEDIFLNM